MHDHNICEHDLKYCAHCDVVYCENCQTEWTRFSGAAFIQSNQLPKATKAEDIPRVWYRGSPLDTATVAEFPYPFGK